MSATSSFLRRSSCGWMTTSTAFAADDVAQIAGHVFEQRRHFAGLGILDQERDIDRHARREPIDRPAVRQIARGLPRQGVGHRRAVRSRNQRCHIEHAVRSERRKRTIATCRAPSSLQARRRAASRLWRLALAEKLGGTIINADSMQVYRDLRIITARPTPEEERRVPHRLYGHVDAAENYSVGRWCGEAGGGAGGEQSARSARRSSSAAPGFISMRSRAGSPPCRRSRPKFATTCAARLAKRGRRRAACRACRARSRRGGAAAAGRPRPRHPRAGSGAGDRPLARGLARRQQAGERRSCRAPQEFF